MEYLLIILCVLCLLVGLAGCVVPVIPGPPIAYLGMLCLHFTERVSFSATTLVMWGIIVLLMVVLDYVIPIVGTKVFGGTKYGNWGCIIGTIVGLILGPLGVIVGPFVGACVGELLAHRTFAEALKSAIGSFLGFLCGTLLKLLLCGYFIYKAIEAFL